MRWRVVHDLSFVAQIERGKPGRIVLQKGEVVETVPDAEMSGEDIVAWRRFQIVTVRNDAAQKPVAVRWLGKVRLLCSPKDVVPAPAVRKLPD